MNRSASRRALTPGLVSVLWMAIAYAQDYAVDWRTVDGGGEMWCTGGDFELSGTVGQPDAGAVMTGGDFELAGGFWSGTCFLISTRSRRSDSKVSMNDMTSMEPRT